MRRLFVALALIGIVVAAALVLAAHRSNVGGLSGSYSARDGDAFLTRVAGSALPVIDALARFRAAHLRYPNPENQEDITVLSGFLPHGIKVTPIGDWLAFDVGGGPAWQYRPNSPAGTSYTLSIKLGWDPRLVYFADADTTRWVFDPGDGSEEKAIALHP
jgi:hypothetical protein